MFLGELRIQLRNPMGKTEQKLPKYLQISGDIVSLIRRGKLAAGTRVPSENDIIRRYRVSNTTARKALQEIEQEGWVERIKARGTFVRRESVGRSVDRILGFTKNMLQAGRVPSTRLLDIRVLKFGRNLKINGREYRLAGPLCRIDRLRLADGIPMMMETRYVDLSLCPGIHHKDLEGSLYQIYEKHYALKLVQVNQDLSACLLEGMREMEHFELEEPVPAFQVEGVAFCGKEMILEMERSLYRGDLYSFSVQARR